MKPIILQVPNRDANSVKSIRPVQGTFSGLQHPPDSDRFTLFLRRSRVARQVLARRHKSAGIHVQNANSASAVSIAHDSCSNTQSKTLRRRRAIVYHLLPHVLGPEGSP